MNAVKYKEIFPLLKDNKLWLGQNAKGGSRKGNSMSFINSEGKMVDVSSWWFTNIDNQRRNTPLDLYKSYTPDEYPTYDNYSAINVDRSEKIPNDYFGTMGVPISFLMFHCPEQFDIIGQLNVGCFMDENGWQGSGGKHMTSIGGQDVYQRILIKRKS